MFAAAAPGRRPEAGGARLRPRLLSFGTSVKLARARSCRRGRPAVPRSPRNGFPASAPRDGFTQGFQPERRGTFGGLATLRRASKACWSRPTRQVVAQQPRKPLRLRGQAHISVGVRVRLQPAAGSFTAGWPRNAPRQSW